MEKETIACPKETITFSKVILTIIVLLYFLGALIGGALVIISAVNDVHLGLQIDTGMFIAYAAYIGGPTATAIGFYAWKSKAENLLKIQNNKCVDPSLVSALVTMGGS